MIGLRTPPEPLTRNDRVLLWVLTLAVAATRVLAISRTMWDWDEALFALALLDYDVTAHHPHPPGFPLFIGLAKLIPLDPFHAPQAIAVVASLFVFPAMFFLGRELRLPAFSAIAAALLLAFFPNVWFYGGTALSDVPSMVLVVTASALLLRGCRSDRSLLAGALVLGIAAGFRPQNLLIGFAPFMLAFLHRRRTGFLGGVILVAIVAGSYGAAASLSGGWEAYRATLAKHERYIREVDSFLSPIRPNLAQVADDFFVRPYRALPINIAITLLAAAGLLRRRPLIALGIALAMFGPFLLFAWLYLDFHSASRFSIGYMPLYALLAAQGIPEHGRRLTLAALTALLVLWTLPALHVVRTTASPPFAAIAEIRKLMPAITPVYVDPRMAPFADLWLPEYERRVAASLRPPPEGVLLREGASRAPGAKSFERDRDRLAGIARPRYFEASLIPAR
ncbi:MAG TPA: hypothetical protein VEK57_02900 [Thermoanaerobaculia bacterium]|nr:hypothetical protein [Thermoanaerobaculia bacterium]